MAGLGRWIIAAAMLAAAPLQAQTADSPQLELGRRYTQWLYEGQTDSLWAKFSAEMRQSIPSAQDLEHMRQEIHAQTGDETEVVAERIVEPAPQPGLIVYVRTARFANAPMDITST